MQQLEVASIQQVDRILDKQSWGKDTTWKIKGYIDGTGYKCMDWIQQAENVIQWPALMYMAMNFPSTLKAAILYLLSDYQRLKNGFPPRIQSQRLLSE
jgi:hypothetical protein